MRVGKKYRNVADLVRELEFQFDEIDDISGIDLKKVCYAPNVGYRSWIFEYKGTYVALEDYGNGFWGFYTTVGLLDVVVARVYEWFGGIREKYMPSYRKN